MSYTGPRPFLCAECGKSFHLQYYLTRHALVHSPDAKRFHCTYPGCTHSTIHKANLQPHYVAKHTNTRPHVCRFEGCSKSFSNQSPLIRHEKLIHGFYRRARKPYERPSLASSSSTSGKIKSEVDSSAALGGDFLGLALPLPLALPSSSSSNRDLSKSQHKRKSEPDIFAIPVGGNFNFEGFPPLQHSSNTSELPSSSVSPVSLSAPLTPTPEFTSYDWSIFFQPQVCTTEEYFCQQVPQSFFGSGLADQASGSWFDATPQTFLPPKWLSGTSFDVPTLNTADALSSVFSHIF